MFDPYREWLKIDAPAQPPDHYLLLGIPRWTEDHGTVRRAADARISTVRAVRPGEHLVEWRRVLDELEMAKRCLIDPASKSAYDAELRRQGHSEEPVMADPVALAKLAEASVVAEPKSPDRGQAPAGVSRSSSDSTSWETAASSSTVQSVRNLLPPTFDPITAPKADVEPKPAVVEPTPSLTGNLLPPSLSGADSVAEEPTSTEEPASASPEELPARALASPNLTLPHATLPTSPAVPFSSAPSAVATPIGNPMPGSTRAAIGVAAALLVVAGVLFFSEEDPQGTAPAISGDQPEPDAAQVAHDGFHNDGDPNDVISSSNGPSSTGTNDRTGRSSSDSEPLPDLFAPPTDPPGTGPNSPTTPSRFPPVTDPPSPPTRPTMPNPGSDPGPEPVPNAPAALSPADRMRIDDALRSAYVGLSERELDAAQSFVAEAERIASSAAEGPHTKKIERMVLLYTCVREFWGAVDEGMKNLSGQDLDVGDYVFHIHEASPRGIRYRGLGRNYKYARRDIPAGVVRAIAERWLNKTANSKVFVGAFLAVDPAFKPDKAREMWRAARAGGAPVDNLMLVLDDYPRR